MIKSILSLALLVVVIQGTETVAGCCTTWTAECYTTASQPTNNFHACKDCGYDIEHCDNVCSSGDMKSGDLADSIACQECCQGYDHEVPWNCPVGGPLECTYVADNRCKAEWGCSEQNGCADNLSGPECGQDEYMYMGGPEQTGGYPQDSDCKLKDCPLIPNYQDNNGLICEADGAYFLGDADTIDTWNLYVDHANGLSAEQLIRPAGTEADLNNCKDLFDIYSVVCTEADGTAIGCTDTEALNYHVFATKDDGTCIFDCIEGWSACNLLTCEETFTIDVLDQNGGVACAGTYDHQDTRECLSTSECATTTELEATTELETTTSAVGKVCSYVPQNDCLDEWDCPTYYYYYNGEGFLQTEDEEVYAKHAAFGGGSELIDTDCNNLPDCPLNPSAEHEGIICEADSVKFMDQLEHSHISGTGYYEDATDAELAAMDFETRPEGTTSNLNNCKTIFDVYEVVCTGGEAETETEETGELCATYTTAASCPASYCVIKNDRHGDFKKCKRVLCKQFNADEAGCGWSAECEPKYKKDGSFKKCKLTNPLKSN